VNLAGGIHAFTWREYILNPEASQKALFSINQLFEALIGIKRFKLGLKITHQQESVKSVLFD